MPTLKVNCEIEHEKIHTLLSKNLSIYDPFIQTSLSNSRALCFKHLKTSIVFILLDRNGIFYIS